MNGGFVFSWGAVAKGQPFKLWGSFVSSHPAELQMDESDYIERELQLQVMSRQPSEEEKQHPAYKRYVRKAKIIVLLTPIVILFTGAIGFLLGGYAGVIALIFIVAIETLTIVRSGNADRKEWQEWRKARSRSAESR